MAVLAVFDHYEPTRQGLGATDRAGRHQVRGSLIDCEAQKKKRPEATNSGYFTQLVRLFHQQCDSLATTDETRFNGFPASFHTPDDG
jgi:hypothetical protein